MTNLPNPLFLISPDSSIRSIDEADEERWYCRAAAVTGYAHFTHGLRDLKLVNPHFTASQIADYESLILQACRIKILNTEFVACPSCGRTQYDIQTVFAAVKKRFAGCPGLKIGVMGCIVNGPGEMADADYGIVGATHGKVLVYKGKERLTTPLEVDDALSHLAALICSDKKADI